MSLIIKPFRGTQLNKTHPLARGLVGAWVLNEATGGKAFDLSGRGNHGTITGATWDGDKLLFDNDKYVEADYFDMAGIGEFSAVLKYRIDDYETHNNIIFGNDSYLRPSFAFKHDNYGRLCWTINDSSTSNWTAICSKYGTGVYTVVLTFKAGTAKAYINGEHKSTDTDYAATLEGNNSTAKIRFGEITRYGSFYLIGAVFHAYIYDRALTDSEVNALHADPYQMFESSVNPMIFVVGTQSYNEPLATTILASITKTDKQSYKDMLSSAGIISTSESDLQTYCEILNTTSEMQTTISDLQQYIENLASEIIAETADTDLQNYLDNLNTSAQAETAIIDIQNYKEQLCIITEAITELAGIQEYRETLTTIVTAESTLANLQEYKDTLAASASAVASVTDKQNYIEALTTTVQALTTGQDWIGSLIEELTATATASASATDKQDYVDTLDASASADTEASDRQTYIEALSTVATAQTALRDLQRYREDCSAHIDALTSGSDIQTYKETLTTTALAVAALTETITGIIIELGLEVPARLFEFEVVKRVYTLEVPARLFELEVPKPPRRH